jgi:hypothetical protein
MKKKSNRHQRENEEMASAIIEASANIESYRLES